MPDEKPRSKSRWPDLVSELREMAAGSGDQKKQQPPSAWTDEVAERFIRLGEAYDNGTLDEQWEKEFPKKP